MTIPFSREAAESHTAGRPSGRRTTKKPLSVMIEACPPACIRIRPSKTIIFCCCRLVLHDSDQTGTQRGAKIKGSGHQRPASRRHCCASVSAAWGFGQIRTGISVENCAASSAAGSARGFSGVQQTTRRQWGSSQAHAGCRILIPEHPDQQCQILMRRVLTQCFRQLCDPMRVMCARPSSRAAACAALPAGTAGQHLPVRAAPHSSATVIPCLRRQLTVSIAVSALSR